MAQVFISYSRSDLAFVEQLAADLEAAGLDVWYDLSDLEGGARWRIEIEKAIRESQYMLVVLSPDSVASEWVEEEILYARNLKRKIIPLFYRQCDLPLGYYSRHYIDIQGTNYKRNFGEILHALNVKPILPKKPPVPEKKVPILTRPERKEETPESKNILTKRKWDSKNVSILVALIALGFVLVFGLPPLLSQPENTPEPTLTHTKKVEEKPIPTETIKVVREPSSTPKPSATPTQAFTLTATPLPTEFTDDFGVEMVLVPAGNFIMGSDSSEDVEGPAHQLYLDAYYIDKYEVTNAHYKTCVEVGGCTPPHQTGSYTRSSYYDNPDYYNYPVVYVDWYQARVNCEWRDGRLPTEAEWEKAARGGLKNKNYPWGDEFANCTIGALNGANWNMCKTEDTMPVGSFAPNRYGLYDIGGNVWEWVSDWYSDTYFFTYSIDQWPPNPTGPNTGTYRVLRSGEFLTDDNKLRPSFRNYDYPNTVLSSYGLRCVKDTAP